LFFEFHGLLKHFELALEEEDLVKGFSLFLDKRLDLAELSQVFLICSLDDGEPM
jgi:hypothetical protein